MTFTKNILVTIVLFMMINACLFANPQECTSSKVTVPLYSCQIGNTCCGDNTTESGWRCYEITDGLCCKTDNDNYVCPSFASCSTGTEQFCEKKTPEEKFTRFLSEDVILKTHGESLDRSYEPTLLNSKILKNAKLKDIENIHKFLEGLYNGLEVFPEINCDILSSSELVQPIKNIVAAIEDLNNKLNTIKAVQEIFDNFIRLKKGITKVTKTCADQEMAEKVMDILEDIADDFSSWFFHMKLVRNVVKNIGRIFSDIEDIKDNFNSREEYENGNKIGKLIRYAILFDI